MKIKSTRAIDKGNGNGTLVIMTDKGKWEGNMPLELARKVAVLIIKDNLPKFPLKK